VRTQRDARYGQLTCGACSNKQRDEFRCVLKGHERKPADGPAYRVSMGPQRRAAFYGSCPVGLALESPRTELYLAAYGLVSRWSKWPPGRDDPRTLEAITVIQREHDLIDAEHLDASPTKAAA
jgi:hypothetical protein